MAWVIMGMAFLAGCITLGSSPTPTLEFTPTPTLQTLVVEPTNPGGFGYPFNLTNITLSCSTVGNYVLEFDYLPKDISISSVGDPNSPATNLTCAYRTPGHGVCSGNMDFSALGVVSLQVCEGVSALDKVCISQSVLPAGCPSSP